MIEIKMPNEINKYEAKAAGPFTLRQLICLIICMPIGIGIFLLAKPFIGVDLAGFLVLIPGAVAFLFGWYKPYGMKFEKYLRSVFISSFLAPSKRVYKTENFYAAILQDIEAKDNGQPRDEKSNKKQKSVKTRKYKRSKVAIK